MEGLAEAVVALGPLGREGDGAQLFGAAAAVIAACAPDFAERADALLGELLASPLRERLGSAASHDLLDKCLLRHAEAALLPGPARARDVGPLLVLVSWRLAEGKRELARERLREAAAGHPDAARLRELAGLDPASSEEPRLRAVWARTLVLSGAAERARRVVASALERWPGDAELERLERLLR